MKLQVSHKTTYRFEPAMQGLVQSLRLTPSIFDGQMTSDWRIDVAGATSGAGFRDGSGDWIETATLLGDVTQASVTVSGLVQTTDLAGVLKGHREVTPPLTYLRATRATYADVALKTLVGDALAGSAGASGLETAHILASAVAGAIAYRPGETHNATTAAEALALGAGVCQDHAHALIAAAHTAGMPARYVIGYLHSSEDGSAHEASHAWAEIYVHDLGWVGFDPSNQCSPDERYIRLGSGFDSVDAAPIRGLAQGAGAEKLDVDVAIQQVAQ